MFNFVFFPIWQSHVQPIHSTNKITIHSIRIYYNKLILKVDIFKAQLKSKVSSWKKKQTMINGDVISLKIINDQNDNYIHLKFIVQFKSSSPTSTFKFFTIYILVNNNH